MEMLSLSNALDFVEELIILRISEPKYHKNQNCFHMSDEDLKVYYNIYSQIRDENSRLRRIASH